MDARFQRLDNSQDITGVSEPSYPSSYYDEPQQAYSDDYQKRTSYTNRKPLPTPSPPVPYYTSPPTQDQPFLDNQFNSPRYQDKSSPPVENQNPFSDPKRASARTSVITKTVSKILSGVRGHHVSHIATPLWAAPWRHQPCPDLGGARASTVREFDPAKQRRRIFFHFFIQWLVPFGFCVTMGVIFLVFSKKPQISQREKYVFNALVLGIGLCLGFAVVNGMKEYVSTLRWRLLARRYRSLQEFETLLGLASQKKALRLMWISRNPGSILPNGTQMFCFAYIALMLTLQVLIALLGLTQSVETATNLVNLEQGNVSIADLSVIQQDVLTNGTPSYQLQSGAVNDFGISGQRFPFYVQSDPSANVPDQDVQYAIRTDNKTTWWYQFTDQCPDPTCTTTYLTDRLVQAYATCKMRTVLAGGFNNVSFITYADASGKRQTLDLPRSIASASTTWMSNMNNTCGPRCTSSFAVNVGLLTVSGGVSVPPQLFECNNTISQVENSSNLTDSAAYQLPDEQARLIAGAIGYNGITLGGALIQGRTYAGASPWSWANPVLAPQTEIEVANEMMHFSMATVLAIDILGDRAFVDGITPVPAQTVEILWFWALLILILLPVIQLLVLLVAVVWGNHAIIQDGSFLATAALLRPVVERLQRTGCALTSDEICEVLGNPDIAYGVREPQASIHYGGGMMNGADDVKHLEIMYAGQENEAYDMAWRVGMKMPPGRYDGLKEE